MAEIGDIFYIKVDRIGPEYYRVPVIIYEKSDGSYRGRFVIPGQLTHDYYVLTEHDIGYYLER